MKPRLTPQQEFERDLAVQIAREAPDMPPMDCAPVLVMTGHAITADDLRAAVAALSLPYRPSFRFVKTEKLPRAGAGA